ncbi:MAG: sugar phosphate isomerase/epimerase [Planctomycetes bacterium]|jgi:sugar phosphate isomerase/epimerase|nr:sugar phosphate isomerase/epimerase [Planctomycetota bacterium]
MIDNEMNRRQMLATAAGLAWAVSGLAFGQEKKENRQRQPQGFRIGVCDWTIGKRCDPAALALAKKIGLDGVQVDFGGGPDKDPPLFSAELQKRYLEEIKTQEMRIASLAMGVLNEVAYKSDPRAEKWVDQAIDVAQALRQRIILLAFFSKGDLKNDAPGTDAVVSKLRNVAAKAEKARVTLAVESWLSAPEHMKLLDRVGSPAVQVYYDVANSHKMGYDIYQEIRVLGKRICQFHAKDYDDLYGKGSIDFPRVRAAMDEAGYRGWFVMEGTKMPKGIEESCRYDAEYLRPIFPRRV